MRIGTALVICVATVALIAIADDEGLTTQWPVMGQNLSNTRSQLLEHY